MNSGLILIGNALEPQHSYHTSAPCVATCNRPRRYIKALQNRARESTRVIIYLIVDYLHAIWNYTS